MSPIEGLLIINTPELVEVVYDPLRSRILRHLAQPMSVKQLAGELQTTPGRLYYHVHLLEQHDLIKIADQQLSNTKLERVYQSSYHSFKLAPELKNRAITQSNGLLIGMLEDIADEYYTAFATWDDTTPAIEWVINRHRRLSPKRAKQFSDQMQTVIEKFFGFDVPDDPDGIAYGQLFVMAPFAELPRTATVQHDPEQFKAVLEEMRKQQTETN